MAFSDPQTVTISGSTISLPRTNTGNNGSEYLSADGLVKLAASSAYGRRTRRVLRLDHSKITADPYIPSQNAKVSMSVYTVFDIPPVGYSNADALAIYLGFNNQVNAASNLLVTKILGGES